MCSQTVLLSCSYQSMLWNRNNKGQNLFNGVKSMAKNTQALQTQTWNRKTFPCPLPKLYTRHRVTYRTAKVQNVSRHGAFCFSAASVHLRSPADAGELIFSAGYSHVLPSPPGQESLQEKIRGPAPPASFFLHLAPAVNPAVPTVEDLLLVLIHRKDFYRRTMIGHNSAAIRNNGQKWNPYRNSNLQRCVYASA